MVPSIFNYNLLILAKKQLYSNYFQVKFDFLVYSSKFYISYSGLY